MEREREREKSWILSRTDAGRIRFGYSYSRAKISHELNGCSVWVMTRLTIENFNRFNCAGSALFFHPQWMHSWRLERSNWTNGDDLDIYFASSKSNRKSKIKRHMQIDAIDDIIDIVYHPFASNCGLWLTQTHKLNSPHTEWHVRVPRAPCASKSVR